MATTMSFVVVTPASANSTEVWVDDDRAGCNLGGMVDGHVYGIDAFEEIQDAIDITFFSSYNLAIPSKS